MARTTATRQYGKQSKKSKAERLFAELPQSPVRKLVPPAKSQSNDDAVSCLTSQLSAIQLEEKPRSRRKSERIAKRDASIVLVDEFERIDVQPVEEEEATPTHVPENEKALHEEPPNDQYATEQQNEPKPGADLEEQDSSPVSQASPHKSEAKVSINDPVTDAALGEPSSTIQDESSLRILTWDDVCPLGDRIDKIAEASFAEVYRVTNERGMSIIKVIRLPSPIKAQTKAQTRSGLVDEEPHSEEDVNGELQISEWLADIPGFVVYKERYIVKGKTSRQLLETHQAFQKKLKKEDPGRAQFYPSPTRYLDDTRFLVVELGDAGTALEDWELTSDNQLWDIFLLEAIALARAEELALFEHRDLHEGNLCIKQIRPPQERDPRVDGFFGYSGVEITILDYGLSRGEDLSTQDARPVSFDLEKDLSLFTSTHAPQCKVYRQMRSFLIRADRICLPPEAHDTPYEKGIDGALSWDAYVPYTNVLWLAYLFDYLVSHFRGSKRDLVNFKKETAEMWKYLNPDAPAKAPCFGSAADIVCFALESGWLREDQLHGSSVSMLDREDSIIISRDDGDTDLSVRRSPRRRRG